MSNSREEELLPIGQSLGSKLVATYSYNFTQYIFIGCEFWQIQSWITFSSYILHACKIFRRPKINSYVIVNSLKLCIKNKFMNRTINNIQLAWNYIYVLMMWDAEGSRSRTHLLLENKKQKKFASKNNLEFTRVLKSTRKKGMKSTRK